MTQSSDIRSAVDRPIIFSAPMVRALLDGRKTQTRRLVKPRGKHPSLFDGSWSDSYVLDPGNADWRAKDVPYGVGDRLYVREAWARTFNVNAETDWPGRPHRAIGDSDLGECAIYRADGPWQWCDDDGFSSEKSHWKPSIHMPRWASRLTLLVDDVRVERLQAISEEDAQAEGVDRLVMDDSGAFYAGFPEGTHRCGFAGIWAHLHGTESWDADPWVVAVTFRVERGNIDQIGRQAA